MRVRLSVLFRLILAWGILSWQQAEAVDLGALQSKLLALTEAVANAEKLDDAERLASLAVQWEELSPLLNRDLAEMFDEAAAKLTADIKIYRTKANDGSLPERTAAIYRRLAAQLQETLKSMMIVKNQTKVLSEKLNTTIRSISERPDVKSLINANHAQKKAAEASLEADQALEKLRKLQ